MKGGICASSWSTAMVLASGSITASKMSPLTTLGCPHERCRRAPRRRRPRAARRRRARLRLRGAHKGRGRLGKPPGWGMWARGPTRRNFQLKGRPLPASRNQPICTRRQRRSAPYARCTVSPLPTHQRAPVTLVAGSMALSAGSIGFRGETVCTVSTLLLLARNP